MNMMKLQICSLVLLSWLMFFPLFVVGECTCDAQEQEEGKDVKLALKYKIVAIISILIASAIGVCLPVLGKRIPALAPEKNIFFVVKAFAAGVILATAFIHILPDAFENLTSPCLNQSPWGNFPFAGLIAMVAVILTLMVDSLATGYFSMSHNSSLPIKVDDENNGHLRMHGHSHTLLHEDSPETKDIRHRVIAQVLELGIVFHSVLIGVTVGVSQSPSSIKPLVAALVFHQFFEGMGLGGCIAQAKFKTRAIVIMVLFFSLTTPVGIGIGIGVSNVYNESSPMALGVQGCMNAAAAGILIYMSLVDLLAADFMSPKMQSSGKLQAMAYTSLLVGACCMSILAKWA